MADQFIIAVTKRNHNVLTETDINDYVFLSNYNTFKIIKTGIYTFTLPAGATVTKTMPHLLNFIPLVHAFASEVGQDQAFPPNGGNIILSAPKGGNFTTGVNFISVAADDTNIIFKFESDTTDKVINIRYFCLEAI